MIVNLQVIAANQHQLALDVLDRLEDARARLKERVLHRDSLPLWQVFTRRQQGETPDFFAQHQCPGDRYQVVCAGELGCFSLCLRRSCCCRSSAPTGCRSGPARIQPASELQAHALEIARHWVALGILPPLLIAFLLAPLAPLPLIGLAILLSFFSILVLLPPLIEPRFHLAAVLPGGSLCLQRGTRLDHAFASCQARIAVLRFPAGDRAVRLSAPAPTPRRIARRPVAPRAAGSWRARGAGGPGGLRKWPTYSATTS